MTPKVRQAAKAGVYIRISRDRATEVSTDVQENECRKLCKARGWNVVDVYSDVGRSAFKRDTPRPAFDRLRTDVEAGNVNHVVAYKVDRIARNVGDFVGFVDSVEQAGATVTLATQDFDTSSASGRLNRNILASFAEFESELRRERIGGSMAHKAANGKAHPGGTRLFGYTASRDAIVKDEARELRAAAKKVLAGKSLAEVARSMNERGVTTTTGGEWRPQVLGRLLRNPFPAGLRAYRGSTVKGEWPAILDIETHEAVVELLDDPARTTTDSTAVRHLLAGITYCNECGARMVSRPLRPGVDRYVCQEVERGGCGKIMVNADLIEERVREHVLDVLTDHADEYAVKLGAVDVAALEREAAELARRQSELAEEWANGMVDRAEWRAAREILVERVEQIARDRKAAATKPTALPRTRRGLERAWDEMTPEERRRLVRFVVDRVEVGPGARGRWDPDRVMIV